MKNIKYFVVGILITLLAACAAAPSGEPFAKVKIANLEKALIYAYRPDSHYGMAITFPVLLNNKKIADIGNKGFFAIELEPGTYSIRPDTAGIDDDLSIQVTAGTTTFLRLNVHEKPPLCFCTSLQFEAVKEPVAVAEMKNTREETTRVYFEKNK